LTYVIDLAQRFTRMASNDAERRELERTLELLGRETRPGRLLAYLGDQYFQHQATQLTEFTIATEVFGRSPQQFDPTQDAVVRVEVHRLRKKLREIYERTIPAEGLRISLPAGSYAPRFSEGEFASPVPEVVTSGQGEPVHSGEVRSPRRWAPYLVGMTLLAAVIAGAAMLHKPKELPNTAAAAASPPATAAPAGGKPTEVHLMAGYAGGEVIDNSGARWTSDRYFTGGGPWPREGGFIRGTSRPFLFANWRSGQFGYDIPLEPGSYEMRLYFISGQAPGDEKPADFYALLNGKPLLNNYDVNVSAHGVDVADEKVFRDVVPDQDGFVRLRFYNQASMPALNALEIVPGTPGKLKPIRIITQPTSFVDHQGQRWRADDYYINGVRSTERHKVRGTADPELFGTERFGHFSYAIPVDRRGRYTVVLHFAELYFGPSLHGGGVGSRIFHVHCNGQALLRDFDIYKEGGSLNVVTRRFSGITPSAQGKITLTFEPVLNNATVSGIEILDESD
jgi:hypothetical protein